MFVYSRHYCPVNKALEVQGICSNRYFKFQRKMVLLAELLNRSHATFHSNNGCINEIREKLVVLLQNETAR